MRKNLLMLGVLMLGPVAARADGIRDFVINPATGFVISASGSYRLTADVIMAAALPIAAIQITTNDVTLDLNGHTITGPTTGTSVGIEGPTAQRVKIFNGRVTQFPGYGIRLDDYATVQDCNVSGNNRVGGDGGIFVSVGSTVERCVLTDNSPTGSGFGNGITAAGTNCRIIGNIIENHTLANGGFTGISVLAGSIVSGNTIRNNTIAGVSGVAMINAQQRGIITGNVITGNSHTGTSNMNGIQAAAGSRIEGNVVADNIGGTAASSLTNGIQATQSIVMDNDLTNNSASAAGNGSGRGILAISSDVRNNRCDSNNGAGTGAGHGIIVTGAGGRIEGNLCRNHTGASGWGIRVNVASTLVIGNFTLGNATASMFFMVATNNRVELNRMLEAVTFDPAGVMPSSFGVGDLADIAF